MAGCADEEDGGGRLEEGKGMHGGWERDSKTPWAWEARVRRGLSLLSPGRTMRREEASFTNLRRMSSTKPRSADSKLDPTEGRRDDGCGACGGGEGVG